MNLPSKTFLIGEYAVLSNGCAVVLNTKPKFEKRDGKFYDPHKSKGGFGASSAKWIFENKINSKSINAKAIISKYVETTWSGIGIPPSGVDVISQLVGGVLAIDLSSMQYLSTDWSFYDFFIIRTGNKVKTYKHLESLNDVKKFGVLAELSRNAFSLFIKKDESFFSCLKEFDLELNELNLCLPESISLKNNLSKIDGVVYVRACGAMGSDTMIVFSDFAKTSEVKQSLLDLNLDIVATQNDIL